MIRINLLPAAKRKRARASSSASSSSINKSVMVMAAGIVALLGMAGGGYYVLDDLETQVITLRGETKKNKDRADEIRKLIDEEALQARIRKVEDLKKAIEKLEAQRRTPVYVMFEVASVLSTGKLPDIDEEKQRKIEASDPQAKLNPTWDASSVWLSSVSEDGSGVLKLAGSARDPADLDEFVKRLRSSVRFSAVSHAEFVAKSNGERKKGSDTQSREYSFTLTAAVSFWD